MLCCKFIIFSILFNDKRLHSKGSKIPETHRYILKKGIMIGFSVNNLKFKSQKINIVLS